MKLNITVECVRDIIKRYKKMLLPFKKKILENNDYKPFDDHDYVIINNVINESETRLKEYENLRKNKK